MFPAGLPAAGTATPCTRTVSGTATVPPLRRDRDRAAVGARRGSLGDGHAHVERLVRLLGRARGAVPRQERVRDEPPPELDEVPEVDRDAERPERRVLDRGRDGARPRDHDPRAFPLARGGVERDRRAAARDAAGRRDRLRRGVGPDRRRGARGAAVGDRTRVGGRQGAGGCECCCEGGGAEHDNVVADAPGLRRGADGRPPLGVELVYAVVVRTRSRPVRTPSAIIPVPSAKWSQLSAVFAGIQSPPPTSPSSHSAR